MDKLRNVKYLFRPKPLVVTLFFLNCMKAKCRKILFCRNDVIIFLTWCILIMISTSLNLCLRVHPIFHGGSKKAIIKETASAMAAVMIKAIETGIIFLTDQIAAALILWNKKGLWFWHIWNIFFINLLNFSKCSRMVAVVQLFFQNK